MKLWRKLLYQKNKYVDGNDFADNGIKCCDLWPVATDRTFESYDDDAVEYKGDIEDAYDNKCQGWRCWQEWMWQCIIMVLQNSECC